mgnify:CR=1 FL=1
MTTRYALYARVSTLNDSQTTSFTLQEEDLSEKIKILYPDYELYKVYGDLGISGTKEDRPEFKRMIQDAKAGKFEVIITKSISRFARNVRLLLNALNELEGAGVGVIFLEENLDTRREGQKFILTVLGGLAEMESSNLKSHIRESYSIKHAAGKMAAPHKTAYGYKRENGETVIDEEEAKIIRKIFNWFIKDGWSSGAIARRLSADGVPVPRPTDNHGKWYRTSVLGILKNSRYCGKPQETERIQKPGGKKKGEIVKVLTFEGPAIISELEFEQAQKIINARKKENTHLAKNGANFQPQKYPLSGLIKCARCGLTCTRFQHRTTVPLDSLDLIDSAQDLPLWGCFTFTGLSRARHEFCGTYMISEQYIYEMLVEAFVEAYYSTTPYKAGRASWANIIGETLEKNTEAEEYEKALEVYEARVKELDKAMEKERDLYRAGLQDIGAATSRIKEFEKQKELISKPASPDSIKADLATLEAVRAAMEQDSREEVYVQVRKIFKNTSYKRQLIRAFVDHIEIGEEPRFMMTVYFKNKQPIKIRTAHRSPYRRAGRERWDKPEIISNGISEQFLKDQEIAQINRSED